jgi:hypothetical protein
VLVVERDRPARRLVEALERVDEVPEEGVAPLFAVGDDVEPGGFLQGDGFVHGAIFETLEFRGGQVALCEASAGVEEIIRSQQAADRLAAHGHFTSS